MYCDRSSETFIFIRLFKETFFDRQVSCGVVVKRLIVNELGD